MVGAKSAITILHDQRTDAYLVRLSPCPPDWSKPEAEFWKRHLAASYVDMLLNRYPGSQARLVEGRFGDEWQPLAVNDNLPWP